VRHHPFVLAGDGPVTETCLDDLPSERLRLGNPMIGQGTAILPLGKEPSCLGAWHLART
jgi:hypothetical protein